MTAKELKASILQLAVTGKLVPQDPNDEPASVLLERIKAEKAKLVKAGKIKKDKNPSEIVVGSDGAVYEKFKDGTVKDITDKLPFEIPTNWTWCRLGDVGTWRAGATPNKSIRKYFINGTIPWLLTGDLNDGVIKSIPNVITSCALKETSVKLNPVGTVLIAMYGATIGRVGVLDLEATTNQACCACIPFVGIVNWYLLYFLMSQREAFISKGEGGAQSNISKEKIVATIFPLPPLAEQKRIVAKIEQLMPLVEKYGEMEEQRLQLGADLPTALEKSILQEAIQGKLMPQDPDDEPASELLKRVATERKALVKAGKLKRDKGESVIFRGSDRLAYEIRNGETGCIQDEIPFEIPASWEWVRLGSVSNYGQCTSVDTSDIQPSTWSLDLEEIEKGTGRLIERKTVAEKKSKSSKHVFTKGTLLYSKLRTYLNKVLVADMDGVCTSEIIPVELLGSVSAGYVRIVLMSPYFLEYTASKGYGIKMPRVGTDDMKQSLIPLPPLAEQKRIAKKVEEMKAKIRTLVNF